MERYFRKINKRSCNFNTLDEKGFFGKSALGLDLAGCRYAILARLTNKAIFSNSYRPNAILARSILALFHHSFNFLGQL